MQERPQDEHTEDSARERSRLTALRLHDSSPGLRTEQPLHSVSDGLMIGCSLETAAAHSRREPATTPAEAEGLRLGMEA